MAIQVLPYDVENYNSLAPVWDASERLGPVSHRAEAFGEIGKVFLEHRFQDIFGVVLLHNHFYLKPGQKLVTLGNAATSWDANVAPEAAEKVNGTSFHFVNGAVTPYEFTYDAEKVPLDGEEMQAFLSTLYSKFRKWGVDNLLGICSLPDVNRPVGTEFTSGNANITLPVDLNPDAGSVEALWHFTRASDAPDSIPFGADLVVPVAFGQCKLRCKLGTEGHQKDHKKNT